MTKNLRWLKENLYEKVREFNENYIEREYFELKYYLLLNISNILENNNISGNLFELEEQIKIVYNNESEQILNKLNDTLNRMKIYKSKLSKDSFYEEEYNKALKELNSFKEMIDKEKIVTLKRINLINSKYPFELYKKYSSFISKLKYEQIIDSNDLEIIKKYFDNIGLNDIEQIKLLEFIRLNNSKISRDRGFRHSGALSGKEVLKMLGLGFVKYDKPHITSIERAKRIDAEALAYANTIQNLKEIDSFLDELNLSDYNFSEKQRLVVVVISQLQNKLLELRELISSKDFYLDISIRDEIIREYNSLAQKCKIMDLYYNNIEEDIEIEEDEKPINKLIFLEPVSSEQEKSYFERDLKDIEGEYLKITFNLLSKFIYNRSTLREIEPFSSGRYKKYIKLKDRGGHGRNRGNVRIVVRPLKDNYYLVLGMAIKKDEVGSTIYDTIIGRYYNIELTDELIEKNERTLDNILKYMKQEPVNNEDKRKRR